MVHVAVHSFVPELDGEVRNADIALLYDSRRAGERDFCRRWNAAIYRLEPRLRLRCNYPYRGLADGLTTWMRRLHPDEHYIGIELEINQALVDAPGWRRLQRLIAASLRELIEADAPRARADRLPGTPPKAHAAERRGHRAGLYKVDGERS